MSVSSSPEGGRPTESTSAVRRQHGGVAIALVVLLVATLLTAHPATGAAELPGVFLYPGETELITGTVEFAVDYLPTQPNTTIEFWIAWDDPDFGPAEFPFDTDEDHGEIGEGGRLPIEEMVPGIWNGVLDVPPNHPPGVAKIFARATWCDPEAPSNCAWEDIAKMFAWVDGTPAVPTILGPSHDQKFAAGGEVEVQVTVPEEVDGVDLFLEALLPPGKGLPKLNQHTEGSRLSKDMDGDETTGDMSCAPTASASSLLWFAEGKYPKLRPSGGPTGLTEDIGKRAGTSDKGTTPSKLVDALRGVIKDAGYADQLEVHGWKQFTPTIEEIETEYARGQDVLLGLYWDDGGAHRVAVEGISKNKDGSTDITIMDPWTGSYETVHVDKDGKAKQGDAGLELGRMIHVSPKPKGEKVGTATATGSGGSFTAAAPNDTYSFTWDTDGVLPGRYLFRAEASDPNARFPDGTERTLTSADFQIVEITGTARLHGTDRFLTALAVSQASYADGEAGAVVLARSDLFPDALSGTPLAIARFAPLLLTPSTALDERVEDEIQRVLPAGRTVYLLGGEAALAPAIADRLGELGYEVVRYGGDDRYETAVAVAEEGIGDPEVLIVASGLVFPDALAGGVAAGIAKGAVVLTAGEAMPEATDAYLTARADTPRYAAGGPAAAADPDAEPLVGKTRFETALLVAQEFTPDPTVVGVATGFNFPDALTGGAHVGRRGGPILLSRPEEVPETVVAYLDGASDTINSAFFYGGTAALSDGAAGTVTAAIG